VITKDRNGYVRIRLDFAEKAQKNSGFLADSDPRPILHTKLGLSSAARLTLEM
jgi:hypothetical protein